MAIFNSKLLNYRRVEGICGSPTSHLSIHIFALDVWSSWTGLFMSIFNITPFFFYNVKLSVSGIIHIRVLSSMNSTESRQHGPGICFFLETSDRFQDFFQMMIQQGRLTERKNEYDAAVSLNFSDEHFAYLRRTDCTWSADEPPIPVHLKTAGASAFVRTKPIRECSSKTFKTITMVYSSY